MNVFDIYIAYVSWDNRGKTRPVLILEPREAIVYAFNITTQYETKSEIIRAKYFKINDWRQAGLNRQSYVDTNTVRDIPKAVFDRKTAIGRLSNADEARLIEFMNR